jgi:SAM-dependent methyltransferase
MLDTNHGIYKRDFWIKDNLAFSRPHFRLEKLAKIVNSIADNRICDLLDVGCGPATLAKLLNENINYFGIDIAIHDPAPNLQELDILDNEIKFKDMEFDIVVASGVFEYLSDSQRQKFGEIKKILKDGGKFILTYINLKHFQPNELLTLNNLMPIENFKDDLREYFHIDRFFACSHNRKGSPSTRKLIRNIQMNLNVYIPLISPLLTLDYFIICSKK